MKLISESHANDLSCIKKQKLDRKNSAVFFLLLRRTNTIAISTV
jgi:hypothetical protein